MPESWFPGSCRHSTSWLASKPQAGSSQPSRRLDVSILRPPPGVPGGWDTIRPRTEPHVHAAGTSTGEEKMKLTPLGKMIIVAALLVAAFFSIRRFAPGLKTWAVGDKGDAAKTETVE